MTRELSQTSRYQSISIDGIPDDEFGDYQLTIKASDLLEITYKMPVLLGTCDADALTLPEVEEYYYDNLNDLVIPLNPITHNGIRLVCEMVEWEFFIVPA